MGLPHLSRRVGSESLGSPLPAPSFQCPKFRVFCFALRALGAPPGSSVRLLADNTTVVNCLKRGGSSRSVALNKWTLIVVTLIEERGWFLTPCYLKGVLNVWADRLSRFTATATEWGLDDLSFQWILTQPGVPWPEVDLFAMPWNRKLPVFVSPVETQGSWDTDALSNHWETVHLFPPLSMISRVLAKLTSFHGRAIVIAPWYQIVVTKRIFPIGIPYMLNHVM